MDEENMDSLVQDFLIESRELLDKYEQELLELEKDPHNLDLLNSIFRAVHTIKGSASFLDFHVLTELTHKGEDVLNKLRKEELEVTEEVVDVLFKSLDGMNTLLNQIADGTDERIDIDDIVEDLKNILEKDEPSEKEEGSEEEPNYLKDDVLKEVLDEFVIEAEENLEYASQELVNWEKDKENRELFNDLYRKIHTVKGSAGFLGISDMAELSHKLEDLLNKIGENELNFDADMVDAMLEAVDNLQAMVKDLKEHKKPNIDVSSSINKLEKYSEGEVPTGKDKKSGKTKKKDDKKSKTKNKKKKKSKKKSSDVKSKSKKKLVKERGIEQTIRVDVKRLDSLMNLVGELVQAKNRFMRIQQDIINKYEGEAIDNLSESATNLNFVTSELQHAVMQTRLVPIGKVFNKYPRMIRTLSKEKNKEIDLVISGEETELDKSIVEFIGDPLVHILRNAADHGIESSEEREKKGKPREGTINLSAFREGDNIVIEIEDDGSGMDADEIAKSAVEKGVIEEEAVKNMSENEKLNLIFYPGFSTANKISNVSGRGVGMDVVRTNIRKLNGTVDIQTEIDKGTKFKIRLPLTLAIVTALLVSVGDEIYSIPITSIEETSRISNDDIKTVKGKEVLNLREMVLPLVRLSEVFDVPKNKTERDEFYVVIVRIGDSKMGLVLDNLLGREEIVIKKLSEYLGNIEGIAGATVLGDGRVSLIIDVNGISNYINKGVSV